MKTNTNTAPPSFGKTFLSTRVIQDLDAEGFDLNISGEPPTVSYFHFTRAIPHCTHSTDAFRALALQLIQSHQHDRTTLDTVSLLLRKTSSQDKASPEDVLIVLALLLRQHSGFIVVDGVDECGDAEHFLTSLSDVCRKSDTRVLIFSRPNIVIPLQYQKWASDSPHIVSLSADKNRADIEAYLAENFKILTDQGYFQGSLDESAISQIAGGASGSFLWASLLVRYLRSPRLTPGERHISLEQYQHIEGIGSLYNLILMTLDRQSEEERRVATDIFRWLIFAINPLCIPKFQAALSITLQLSSTEHRPPLHLEELVPCITGGLVEVTGQNIIFAEKSFLEYLQSSECPQSEFNMSDHHLAHAHLAARCLAYLTTSIPRQPLQRLHAHIHRPSGPINTPSNSSHSSIRTGSSNNSNDSGYNSLSSEMSDPTDPASTFNHTPAQEPPNFDTNMPLLRYASLCWPIHLARALPLSRTHTNHNSPPHHHHHHRHPVQTPWLPPLSHLLTDRPSLTAWLEASWRYGFPPNVSRLVPLLVELQARVSPPRSGSESVGMEERELRWVVQGLRELNEKLREVRREFGASLLLFPGLVWRGDLFGGAGTGPGDGR